MLSVDCGQLHRHICVEQQQLLSTHTDCLILDYSLVFARLFSLCWVKATVPAADLLCHSVKSISWAALDDTWLLIKFMSTDVIFCFLIFSFLCEEHHSLGACAGDLKDALTVSLNRILQPVRDHFENNAEAAALLKKVKVCFLALPHVNCQHTTHLSSRHFTKLCKPVYP